MNKSLIFTLTISFVLLAASCTVTQGSGTAAGDPSATEIAQFQKIFMSSYYAERSGSPTGAAGKALTPFLPRSAGGSRATVPVSGLTTSAAFASLAPTTLGNYPEPGQTTTFTATPATTVAPFKVYVIKATTSYPASDLRKSYVEEYFLQDIGPDANNVIGGVAQNSVSTPDGIWTIADPIVENVGGVWTQNQKARIQQVLTFTDGTTRSETIVQDSNAGGPKLDPAAFDIGGSLFLSNAVVPASTTDANVMYSSIVVYNITPSKNPNFWFWQGSSVQTVLGVRYYTEIQDAAAQTYTARTLSFEKTVDTLTTTGGSMTTTVQGVYTKAVFDALAETVLRQQVVSTLDTSGAYPTAKAGTGQITSNMKTRVVNIAGKKDFILTQLNADAATLTSLGTTNYILKGDVTELLAADSTVEVFARTQQVTPASGSLPYAIATSDVSGTGALATVYTSLVEQTYAVPITVGTAPTSNLLSGAAVVASFNGQQAMGTLIDNAAITVSGTMGATGTVEAWIYINAMTDTAGIVHKGVSKDFSDECFSLQGWGNSGQIGIILDKPTGTNVYDSVLSKVNLATKKWYYVVATWDVGAKTINLYINGKQDNSGAPSGGVTAYRTNNSGVLIGSQLPAIYSTQYGYFGFNGKIVGASISASFTDAKTVAANYALYKGQTGNW